MRHSTPSRHSLATVLLAGAALAAAGCNRDNGDSRTTQPAIDSASTDSAAVRVDPGSTNVPSGTPTGAQAGADGSNPLIVATAGASAPYVANSAGTALYSVEGDTDGSKCSGDCTLAWPPFLVGDAAPSASPGLQAGMIGMVQRADGGTQVTYNGHPLYRYGADTGAGRTAGQGVSDQWGEWALIGPQGDRLAAAK
jgi:predicted lipoprotein with Yx(FWY)xxD motif